MRVRWSERARAQIREIFEYVCLDRPEAAERLLDGFLERVDLLADHPEQGRVWGEGRRTDLRAIVYESHRVIYRVGHEEIAILSVRHTRLDVDD